MKKIPLYRLLPGFMAAVLLTGAGCSKIPEKVSSDAGSSVRASSASDSSDQTTEISSSAPAEPSSSVGPSSVKAGVSKPPWGAASSSASSSNQTEKGYIDSFQYSKTKGTATVTQLKLPSVFGNSMVLQRNKPIHIYGQAKNCTEVVVKFLGGTYKTVSSAQNGSFIVNIPPTPAGRGHTLTVESAGDSKTFTDVSVGEVFLCGGQSNMQLTMDDAEWYGTYYTSRFAQFKDNADIRQFLVDFGGSSTVQTDHSSAGWKKAQKGNFEKFAPLAYLFAVQLQEKLKIPVGLVMSSAGGSAIQLWMPAADQKSANPHKSEFDSQKAVLYNHMTAPLMPFTFSAALWYQGEANASFDESAVYQNLLTALINAWRRELYDNDLPFYVAELAGYSDDRFAMIREAQLKTAKAVSSVHLIPNADLGDPSDIHPKTKDALAARFCKFFLGAQLKQSTPYLPPEIKDIAISGAKVTLTFDNVYSGLKASSAEVTGFTLADENGRYYKASGKLVGSNKVEVTSDRVTNPKNVRYCMKGYSEGNLKNSADIPPYPFRSDTVVLRSMGTTLMN